MMEKDAVTCRVNAFLAGRVAALFEHGEGEGPQIVFEKDTGKPAAQPNAPRSNKPEKTMTKARPKPKAKAPATLKT